MKYRIRDLEEQLKLVPQITPKEKTTMENALAKEKAYKEVAIQAHALTQSTLGKVTE